MADEMSFPPPPAGYATWLDYAVETMDTRSPSLDGLLLSEPVEPRPSRAAMLEAARQELQALRRAAATATSADPIQSASATGLVAARERGDSARRAWTRDGTLLSAHEFARRRGLAQGELEQLKHRRQVFSVPVAGVSWYPAALLGLSPDDGAALCQALGDDDAARNLVFLMRRHGALAGRTVVEAIVGGARQEVLALAQAWRES
jgi:hypothetical protein